jgi:hypothetical protein
MESLKTYFNGFESKYAHLGFMVMKLKFLRLFFCIVVFTPLTFIAQYNAAAQTNQNVLHRSRRDAENPTEMVIHGAEGVEFKTLVPEKPVIIPKEGESIPIKLGLRRLFSLFQEH